MEWVKSKKGTLNAWTEEANRLERMQGRKRQEKNMIFE
jgi:hypothetical protein